MAKETKIGLALCVLLIGAFAFVVYSKMNKQQKLDDDFIAGTDSSIEDAPPPFEDDTHADFGGEPGHHHGHSHDNNEPFTSDSETRANSFDVPQRPRRRHDDDFEQFADSGRGRGRQSSDDPWKSRNERRADHRSRDHAHSAGGDDPFVEASHRHEHGNARQTGHEEPAFGDESEFGFEQDQPAKKTDEAKTVKKTWNLADFLGGGKQAEKPAPEPAEDDSPFGAEPTGTAATADGLHDHDHKQAEQSDDFNPFASTEKAANAHDQQIQQSGGRATVEDRNRGNAFGDEQEVDNWGSESVDDRSGFGGTEDLTTVRSGSRTQVQQPADTTDGFGFPDDAKVAVDPRDQSNGFSSNKFRATPPAPQPDRRVQRGGFDQQDQFGHDHAHDGHDSFSQPFADGDDHHHGGHLHANGAGHRNDRPTIYVVERGDNFWDISKKQYGAGRYYKALALYNKNRIPDPRKMRPGMKVLIPTPETLATRFPALCPWQTAKPTGDVDHSDHRHQSGFFTNADGQPRYRVDSRDTLTAIAKDHLGRASRWVQVYALNRDRIADPAKLKIGTILRLPADASRVQLVRRSRQHR